jgi:ribose transport system substrate-binding protein
VFYLDNDLAAGMAGAIQTASQKGPNDLMLKNLDGATDVKILRLQYSPSTPSVLRSTYLQKITANAGIPSSAFSIHEVTIPGAITDAQNATEAWLTAHPASAYPHLVIWTAWSDAAVGALAALSADNRSVPIYTWDLTKQVVSPIKQGKVVATALADPKGLAKQLVGMIDGYMKNGKREGLDAPAVVLTKSNIDAYLKANPGAAQ